MAAGPGECSERVRTRVLAARTIADLCGEERVGVMRLAEALQYRAYEARHQHEA